MTRDQIITTVLSRLGRQEGNTYLVGRAEDEIQLIQQRLEGAPELWWFLLTDEDTSLSTTANVRTVDLPADFLREFPDFPLYRYDSTADDPYIKLEKDEFDVLESRFGNDEPGEPTHYCLVGSQFHFFPTPDDDYPLRWVYFAKEDLLSDAVSTNAWTDNASDLLIGELGQIMAGMKRDEFWLGKFAAETAQANQRLLAFDEARKQAARPGYRGDL